MTCHRFSALACPLDGEPLLLEGSSWRCSQGHSFDVARQGHVHLLPVQNKRSLQPGDSKEMVAARRHFLSTCLYQPIADAVNRAVLASKGDRQDTLSCLDAGCGEGYYLLSLGQAAADRELSMVGLDISKWAVLAAAKIMKDAQWVVGTNARLPILPESLDRVLCLFGFPVYEEFHRVIKTGGRLIQVDAGPNHLRELREIVYPTLKPAREPDQSVPEGFALESDDPLSFDITLDSQPLIQDLLAMTPHLYRASVEGRERAQTLESLAVTVDIRLRVFERIATG
ncbi:putative RNA methyltransferase [Marinobacter sp. CHS3-4]|uniref:putative RNA methyltransferase n=1 Tax=Marinobacter sp. CHS3-4 TaxID=3045174 RepID=UPI0024B558EE|nr:methyltransferase domain-containing protein [Marinobacter sp. CHS3-4]MDI9243686.1 methyltransferase domain-containing protein [Marinobacter sp. CHS3-4]